MRSTLAVVIISLAVAAGAVPMAALGQSAPSVDIGDISDSGRDLDGDGLFDELMVSVSLNLSAPGSFYVVGSITDRVLVSEGAAFKSYPAGPSTVELVFNGTELYRGMRDGPYNMVVQVISTDMAVASVQHRTAPYAFTEFQHARDQSGRQFVRSTFRQAADDSMLFETANLTTKISINEPVITFFYRNGTEDQACFVLRMERVIGFVDSDHDMVYDPSSDKTIMSGGLASAQWEFIGVIGSQFDFMLEGSAAMKDGSGGEYPVKFRLIFPSTGFISDRSYKFDYELEFGKVLPGVTNVAVVHTITDTTGGHTFREVPDMAPGMLGVQFVRDDNGEVRGSYSWVDRADVESQDGSSSSVRVFYAAEGDRGAIDIYLSYEYSPSTLRIYHDPVLEINPLAFSIIKAVSSVFGHNPAFYVIAAAATAAAAVGALAMQHRRLRRQAP